MADAESNVNYLIYANGSLISNPTVTVTLSAPLAATTPSNPPGDWSIQVNAWAPTGTAWKATFIQWVFIYDGANLTADVEAFNPNSSSIPAFAAAAGREAVPATDFGAGTMFQIALTTNSTGQVVSAKYTVSLPDGTQIFSATLATDSAALPAPSLVAMETNIVGYCCSDYGTFTSGAGSISSLRPRR